MLQYVVVNRTFGELENVRCSVRTILVRSRKTTPTPKKNSPPEIDNNILVKINLSNSLFIKNNNSHWEFIR